MTKSNSIEVEETLGSSGPATSPAAATLLSEEPFRQVLCRERKRSERSRKNFFLMLLRRKASRNRQRVDSLLQRSGEVLSQAIRETDLAGWFENNRAIGVIFTELGAMESGAALKRIESKITLALQREFTPEELGLMRISFYSFPEGWEDDETNAPWDPALYPDFLEEEEKKKPLLIIKRVIDIVGSASALILLSPAFLVLAILIKLTSKGPVFFRQQRVGQFSTLFTFLKFRSMRVATDPSIHQEYVRNFIAGKVEIAPGDGAQSGIFKITNDPRVTWIGKFMRRTSLDELPQFWNVLRGEMSLVGPRPPIPYEIEAYDVWHRRRFIEAKPGITGLWQVKGRSRTTFDEMVRLDLQYAKTWTPLLDVKILLRTPGAVFSGDGAY